LGLHIVKLVAEAHGGSARARNLPNDKGVEFTLRLPHRR
jgi:signal transduction histidine kinase